MSDNVIHGDFGKADDNDIPADRVLNDALSHDMAHVLVAGITKDGTFIAWTTSANIEKTLLLTELAKRQLLETCFDD